MTLVPDLRLERGEHAADGEFVFPRWAARCTGPDRPFEGIGTDRFQLRDGLVAESLIMSDLAAFAVLARLVGRGGRLGAAWHDLGSFASGSQNLRPQCGHRMGGVR